MPLTEDDDAPSAPVAPGPNPADVAPGHRIPVVIFYAGSWLYLCLILAVFACIHALGERWWIATMVMFGPRWIYGLPLLIVVPLALVLRHRSIWLAAICAVCFIFLILGVRIPWRTWVQPSAGTARLRLLTCNIHRQMLDSADMARFMTQTNPDVVVLQEWTSRDEHALFPDPAWNLRRDGELFIASRFPIEKTDDLALSRWGIEGACVCYFLRAPFGVVRLVNLHLASPHIMFADALHRDPAAPAAIESNCATRRDQSEEIAYRARTSLVPTLIAGDFNTPPESEIFAQAWNDFSDAFNVAGTGIGNTYHARWTDTRIDHILCSKAWHCRQCQVGPPVGSPHHPVVAEFCLTGR